MEQFDTIVCSVVFELSVSVFIVSIPFIWITVFTDFPLKPLKCTTSVMKEKEERKGRKGQQDMDKEDKDREDKDKWNWIHNTKIKMEQVKG